MKQSDNTMPWHTIDNSKPSTFLQGQAEEYLQTFCLDTYLLELAKSNPTRETSSCNASETESCQPSPYGTTFAHCKESRGEDQLTFFVEDFRVKTSQQQEKELALLASVRAYGESMRDSLTRCGLTLSLPRTHRFCGSVGLTLCSETLPTWGIMLDGACWEVTDSCITSGEGFGYWPTVVCVDSRHAISRHKKEGEDWKSNLGEILAWIYEEDCKSGSRMNPEFVEWLMGWPQTWTEIKPLEMDKIQEWLHSHSQSSAKE